MAKLVRHLTSNEEIVSSTLAEGIFFNSISQLIFLHNYFFQFNISIDLFAQLL